MSLTLFFLSWNWWNHSKQTPRTFCKSHRGNITEKKYIYIYIYKTLGFTMGGGSRLKKLIRKYKTAHKKENNDVKYLSHTLHFSVTLVQV